MRSGRSRSSAGKVCAHGAIAVVFQRRDDSVMLINDAVIRLMVRAVVAQSEKGNEHPRAGSMRQSTYNKALTTMSRRQPDVTRTRLSRPTLTGLESDGRRVPTPGVHRRIAVRKAAVGD